MAASTAGKSSRKTASRKTARRKTPTSTTSTRKSTSRTSASAKATSRKSASGKTAAQKTAARKTTGTTSRSAKTSARGKDAKRGGAKRWSQRVTDTSDALDLKQGVFKLSDPKKIAASLKRSAETSDRRKTGAYRSALSMLTFYINRAGKNLPKTQRDRLQRAKDELKRQFGKE